MTNELDGLSLYLREARQVPLLSAAEEARLPMRQQVLMWLRYDITTGQMRTQTEVAQMLKMSPQFVGVMERQIKRRLRQSLLAAEAGATPA